MAEAEQPIAAKKGRFPRRFGRYVLLKELGQGGMGRVFLAVTGQAGVERVCSLKIVRRFQADRDADEMTQRFLDEAKVATKLSHENLVYVFDFGIVDRQGYLAMEYVSGKTLTEIWNRCAVKRVGFPPGLALFLVTEIVAGLAYAHSLDKLGLVHRDVSPSNIMVAYTGGVKLIDFGLAKWNDKVAKTAAGVNWGKISYMSPEQHRGKPIDHRSDLFSAGVILWELLTGRQLFSEAEGRKTDPEIPPPSRFHEGLSSSLDAVVLRALATDPAARFESGEQMIAALAAEMPRDGGKLQVASFLRQLFEADIKAEATEQSALVAQAAGLPEKPGPAAAGNDDRDPLVGTVLAGRYYVRRRIGEGAMGKVYEGHHTGIGKRVAIKIPRAAERRKAELAQRFRLEALAPSQIGQPNIADVTDCGSTPSGDFFFVMEFIDGIDLDKLIAREGGLPLERAALIAVQICRAVEAAHKAGIIHRDLKPSNVMLLRKNDEADFVKVLDFGVAKFLRNAGLTGEGSGRDDELDLTQADAAVGTPRFMAPEQIHGGKVDFRADIYAVGGILYAMLSGGRAPIEGDSVHNVWQRKVSEDPTPLRQHRSDIPSDVEALVMACLARDPGARPASAEALKKELLLALERIRAAGSSVLGMKAPSDTATFEPKRAAPARKRLALAAAAALFAAGGATATVLLSGGGPRPEPSVPGPSVFTGQGVAAHPRPRAENAAAPEVARLASAATTPGAETAAPEAPHPAPVQPAPGAVSAAARAEAPPAPPVPAGERRRIDKPDDLHVRGGPRASSVLAAPTPAPSAAARAGARPRPRPAAPAAPAAPPVASDDPNMLLAKAEADFAAGNFVPAALKARRAAVAGAGVRAWLLLGKSHEKLDDHSEALRAYQQALRLEPGHAAALDGERRTRAQIAQGASP